MEKDISSINDDFKIQKIEWPVKRIFWFIMGVFIFAGLLGLFGDGSGVLNKKNIKLSDVAVEYEVFLRVEKKSVMKVNIVDSSIKDCSVAFNKEYIDKVQITQVIPEPKLVESNNNKIIYKFESCNRGTFIFYVDPQKMGRLNLELEVSGRKVSIFQYIYF